MLPEAFTPAFLGQLELFKIRARRSFLGSRQGGHLSPKRGHGIEFSDYRQYELGDNPRHIDWGVFARTERLYVKRFQEEQNLSVLLVLDASASMVAVPQDGKWELARDLALSLGYIALMDQDAASIGVLGEPPSSPYIGARAFHILASALENVSPPREVQWVRDIQRAAARVRFPGVAVVLSDFLMPFDEIERGINALRAKNLDLTAIQVLGASDLAPLSNEQNVVALDSETGEQVTLDLSPEQRQEYQQILTQHEERLAEYFSSARIGYAKVEPSEGLAAIVQEVLPQVGILR